MYLRQGLNLLKSAIKISETINQLVNQHLIVSNSDDERVCMSKIIHKPNQNKVEFIAR